MLGARQWRHVALRHGAFFVSRQHRLCCRWPWRTSIISKLFIYTMSNNGFYSKLYFTMKSLEIMLKIILTVNFKRCLISSSLFEASEVGVISLFIGFACSQSGLQCNNVVFCRCLCTCLWSLCWRRCLRYAKRCSLCFAFVFFDPLAMNFGRRSPEEFQWKIFAGEDFQPLVVLAFLCQFAWEIARDSPIVNVVSQTIEKHRAAKSILPGNKKCFMT